jgi:hypothetical protein
MKQRKTWPWPAPIGKVHFNPKAMRKLERLVKKYYEAQAAKNETAG